MSYVTESARAQPRVALYLKRTAQEDKPMEENMQNIQKETVGAGFIDAPSEPNGFEPMQKVEPAPTMKIEEKKSDPDSAKKCAVLRGLQEALTYLD